MKTFDEFRAELNEDQIDESYLRKGAGLVFARQSKVYGDRAVKDFKSAQEKFRVNPNATVEEGMKSLSDGLSDLSRGLENLRNQNGAITSLVLTGVLLSEKKK